MIIIFNNKLTNLRTKDFKFTRIRIISKLKFSLNVTENDSFLGTTNIRNGKYEEDSQVTIKAIPSEFGEFKFWNDGITENPYTITINSDLSYKAIFELAIPNKAILMRDSEAQDTYMIQSGDGYVLTYK